MLQSWYDKGIAGLMAFALLVTVVLGLLFGAASGVQEECVPPPEGMISWWPGDGHALDVAGGNHGHAVGAAYAAGMVDGALSFDGEDDYVSMADGSGAPLDGLSAMTVEAWIHPHTYGWSNPEPDSDYDAAILGKYDSTATNGLTFYFLLRDGRLRFVVYGDGGGTPRVAVTAADEISLNQWSHVAGVWRGADQLELYVNGSVVSSTISTVGTLSTTADSDTPVEMGRANSYSGTHTGPAAYFHGLLDEVTVYGRALESSELASIYYASGKCKASLELEQQYLPAVLKPLPTATPGPYPFVKSETSPLYLQNFNGLGCEWMGVAGEVLDGDRNPVPAGLYNVHVWGSGIDKRAVVGSNQAYGPSGWEITLAGSPIVRTYNIQMETLTGAIVSHVYAFASRASCNQNLIQFNFVGQE